MEITITDDGNLVLVDRVINGRSNIYEVAKPFRVDRLDPNTIVIRDILNQEITIKRSDVVSPSSTNLEDLENILVGYNNTASSGGVGLIASKVINLKDIQSSAQSIVTFDGDFPETAGTYRIRIGYDTTYLYDANHAEFADFAAFKEFVASIYEDAEYTTDDISEFELELNTPQGQYNGKTPTIEYKLGIGSFGTALSDVPIFAGGESIAQPNIIDFIGSNLANNTGNFSLVAKMAYPDTYVPKGENEVSANAEFTLGSYPIAGKLISVKLDAVEQFTFTSGTYSSTSDFLADLYTNFLSFGYSDFGQADPNGFPVAPIGTGATYNGQIISITSDSGATDYLSSSTAFSGGVTAVPFTSFDFTQNDNIITFGGTAMQIISQLTSNKIVSSASLNSISESYLPIFNTSGNWALPVEVGTQEDFRVKINIYGANV